jgi:site-specific DNA-methyltransferase (adenine-specific)
MKATYRRGRSPDSLRELSDASVDAIVTDPPYGTGTATAIYGRRKEGRVTSIANDTDLSELVAVAPEMFRVLKRFGVALVFAAPTKRSAVEAVLEDAGFRIDGFAPWDKGAPGISYGVRYSYEECVIASHYGTDAPFEIRDPLVVPLRVPRARDPEHPNEKPVGLLRRLIAWACPAASWGERPLILDPFAGVASCGVAAIAERCDYFGVECDEQWWTKAERRIADALNRPHEDLPQQSLFTDPEAA